MTVTDHATGAVTFDLLKPIKHADGGQDDNTENWPDPTLIVNVQIEDKDCDVAFTTVHVKIDDDMPVFKYLRADGDGVTIHDETPGTQDDDQSLGSLPSYFKGLFNAGPAIGWAEDGESGVSVGIDFGADGPASGGGIQYALSLTSATGVDSGLKTTAGLTIWLFQEGDIVVGRVGSGATGETPNGGGAVAFAVAIQNDGDLQVAQYLALKHPTGDHDEDIGIALDALQAKVIATDEDGDSASQTVNIGNLVRFDDDGPNARDDFDNIQTSDGGVTFFAAGNVISGASTIDPGEGGDTIGADLPGTISALLGFGGSSDSDPTGGFVVNGKYGTLTMDANGNYTYDLDETKIGTIPSGATEQFTYTLSDGDTDTDTAKLTIKFPEAKIPKTEIGVGPHMNGVMKEDVSSAIYFEVEPQQSSDTVVHVKITGLIGWNLGVIDGATVDILGPAVDSNITFDPVTGVLEFDVTGAGAGNAITGFFNALPPQDTDKDQPLTITATVQDGPVTAVGTDNTTVVVDAVLDQFMDVTAGAIAPLVEPVVNTPVSLNLTSAFAGGAGNPFANSFAGGAGADGDGSEIVQLTAKITVTGDVAQLQLTAPIAGVTLTETATPGVWNLTANNLANLQLALTQVQAIVPVGFNGAINGSVEVTTKEANTPQGTVPASGQEPQTNDNTYTDKTSFSIQVEEGVKTPTVGVNFTAPSLVIKEDSSAFFIVTANVPDATDKISKLNFTGLEALILAGWGVVVTPEAPTTGAYVAGEFTVTSVGQTAQVRVTLTPPEDSDRDVINDILADITVTATAADISSPALTATSAPLPVDVDVDAVLDEYAAVQTTVSPTASESGAPQNVNLNLAATINPGIFAFSGAGGPDGDNSEIRPVSATITLSSVAIDLTLGAGFPAGTTLVETPVGSGIWTLTATNAANLQSAVTFVEAIIPANFNGAVSVNVQVVTAEANTPPATPGSVVPGSGQEYDNFDNKITAIGIFNLTVNNSAQSSISGEICFAEDGVFNQYDQSLPQTSVLGQILYANVVTLGVDESLTALTVTGIPAGATLTINGVAVTNGVALTAGQITDWKNGFPIVVAPPADKDNDFELTFSGSTTDGSSGAVSPIGGAVDVLVDAAADDPTSVTIDVISTSGDEQFVQNETGTAKITATFGDVTDGSEAHTLTITAPAGFTFPSVNAFDGIPPANISGLGTGTVTVIVPAGDTGVSNFVLNVQAPASFAGTPTFQVEAKAVETPTDLGCGPSDTDDTTNNTATQTASDQVTFLADKTPIAYDDKVTGDEPAPRNCQRAADPRPLRLDGRRHQHAGRRQDPHAADAGGDRRHAQHARRQRRREGHAGFLHHGGHRRLGRPVGGRGDRHHCDQRADSDQPHQLRGCAGRGRAGLQRRYRRPRRFRQLRQPGVLHVGRRPHHGRHRRFGRQPSDRCQPAGLGHLPGGPGQQHRPAHGGRHRRRDRRRATTT